MLWTQTRDGRGTPLSEQTFLTGTGGIDVPMTQMPFNYATATGNSESAPDRLNRRLVNGSNWLASSSADDGDRLIGEVFGSGTLSDAIGNLLRQHEWVGSQESELTTTFNLGAHPL